MKLLAIDTSTKVAGVALMEDGRLVCETNLVSGLTHSERLMPIVDCCLRLARWKPEDIDVLAVVSGPGSFTGVRIGVATVKGMAEALGKPVVAVNTLETLAASCAGFSGVVAPILDARRGQVYCAAYDMEPDGDGVPLPRELAPPDAMLLSEFLEKEPIAQSASVLFCGDGVPVHRALLQSLLGDRARFAPPHLLLQRAGAAAVLAWRKAEAGQTMDAALLLPLYLRKSQAEQAREASL
jgi:tRNA threonylcarbamoyladenosine biosynthesis protein TsaB